MVPVGLAAVAQPRDAIGERAVVGDDRAAVAERPEILGRVEAERTGPADGADRAAVRRGQMRLAAVLDDRQVVARGDPLDASHICRLSVEMHRQDGAGPRTDAVADSFRVERRRPRVDVGEDRPRAGHQDRERAVGRRQRRRDHFVAGADAEPAQN
jgi:hypothetical protein